MAVPDPDLLYFQYFGGSGVAEIALEATVDKGDWDTIHENDVYTWSYGNRRTFWSFFDEDAPLELAEASLTGTYYIVAEGFWDLAQGRDGMVITWDAEDVQLEVQLWTLAGVSTLFVSNPSSGVGVRNQGTITWTAIKAIVAAGEGIWTVKMKPLTSGAPARVHGLKLQEQRIAKVDLT